MTDFMLSDPASDAHELGNIASFPVTKPKTPEPTDTERAQYRTIWISDVHLGTKGCNALVEHHDGRMEILNWPDIIAARGAEAAVEENDAAELEAA